LVSPVRATSNVDDKMVTWARATFNDTPSTMRASFPTNGMGGGGGDPAFTSPMVAAGITSTAHQTWLDRGWTYMKGTNGGSYYSGSITLLSMLASPATGGFPPVVWEPARPDEPP
jgi:hypothetical protein